MSPKYSGPSSRPTSRQSNALTHEGGRGYTRPVRTELFLQAVTEMAEDKFYESKEDRAVRLAANVKTVVSEPGGWAWLGEFVTWLRRDAGMRSASIMVAAEAIAAHQKAKFPGLLPGLTPRQLVSAAILRPDEPAEMLGYWLSAHSRQIPAAMKRGIADSAVRLYNEKSALKYDGQSRSVRMGDVIDMCHPTPSSPAQSALFKFLIDRRHKREDLDLSLLPIAALDNDLMGLPESRRMASFDVGLCQEAGWSWERIAGWLPGGLTSEVWERIIPSMGYMALLRNLRNFDQAGVSNSVRNQVIAKLADPAEVARSMQFPYRFFSAWKATESMFWGQALESALDLSVQNIPTFEGRTLVLVDTSGSMQSPIGGERSQVMCCDVAALFGAALASRNVGRVDMAVYADHSAPFDINPGASILRVVKKMNQEIGRVGYGTNTWGAIHSEYKDHDRIIVLTDEQSHDYGKSPGCFMHFFNLSGYRVGTAPKDNRTFAYGGFIDAMFRLLPLMEQGSASIWPWA